MDAFVHSLSTAVPDTVLHQREVRDVFASQPDLGRLGQRLVATAFDGSGIDTRHSVIEEFDLHVADPTVAGPEKPAAEQDDSGPVFVDAASHRLLNPGTAARNELYTTAATRLAVEAARSALARASGIAPDEVTHIVTVSCTGFFSPGPDFELITQLGLNPNAQRYHLGFMGCSASIPGLRLAQALCLSDPNAVVLVVSVELCTLHVRSSNDPDLIIASSLFSDGAAAALVSARSPAPGSTVLALERFATMTTPVGEDAMAWTIGDHGFEMILSSYVPHIIGDYIDQAVDALLAESPRLASDPAGRVSSWAVHPGGRSIVDRVQERLGLADAQVAASRSVLRRFGNMSSATVLFVLRQILDEAADAAAHAAEPRPVCAMAFGPGLTVESALMSIVTADAAD